MNAKHLLPAALLALAGASTFATTLGNELTERPQPASTLTRAEVQAETRAAMKNGSLERSSYDELESVAVARQAREQGNTAQASRAEVRAETRAFFKAHPNAQYELETYGLHS